MGILRDPKAQETPGSAKRRSLQPDFANLGPLKPGGTVGFVNFRDSTERKKGKKSGEDDEMDSEDDEDNSILGKADEEEGKEDDLHLSPDDIRRQGELAESIRKIKVRQELLLVSLPPANCCTQLKRQHSSASLATNTPPAESASPKTAGDTPATNDPSTTPPAVAAATAAETPKPAANPLNGGFIGSPLKKQRASVSHSDEDAMRRRMESGLSQEITNVGPGDSTKATNPLETHPQKPQETEDEEL